MDWVEASQRPIDIAVEEEDIEMEKAIHECSNSGPHPFSPRRPVASDRRFRVASDSDSFRHHFYRLAAARPGPLDVCVDPLSDHENARDSRSLCHSP